MTQSDSQIRISDLIIEKFWDVFNDDEHTHKILTSGRAGTKSSEAAIETVFKIVQDIDGSAVVIRKRHNKLRKTVYKEIKRAIKRLGLDERLFKITVSPMEITFLENGNTIYFTGSDNIDDTKGIIDESKPIKLVLIDEVNEFFEQGEGEDELQNIEATFIRGNDEGSPRGERPTETCPPSGSAGSCWSRRRSSARWTNASGAGSGWASLSASTS